jgi:hypothetical protein
VTFKCQGFKGMLVTINYQALLKKQHEDETGCKDSLWIVLFKNIKTDS